MFCNLASRQNLARRVASRAGNCVERRLFGNKSPYAGFLFLSAAQASLWLLYAAPANPGRVSLRHQLLEA